MKLSTYIKEALDGDKAPEIAQKYLGLKYADGTGPDTKPYIFTVGGKRYGRLNLECGEIEGQKDVLAAVWDYANLNAYNASVAVINPKGNKMDVVAIYYLNERNAKTAKDMMPDIKHIVCKDLNDMVENIRNDYGKNESNREKGHKKEEGGLIYTY